MAHCMDEENFKRILECPICLERITSPRCLPCLHSFCEKCIGQHMAEKQTNGSFPCPVCTLEFQVPPDGVSGFQRNLYLELFPEVSEVKCGFCKLWGTDNVAASMCIQCGDHLCQRCADSHCLSKLTVRHRVVSLEEIRSGKHLEEIRQFQQVRCPKHVNETLKVFCEDCVKPLCDLCAIFEHYSHKKEGIEEAAKKAIDVMQGLLEPWKMASDHSALLSSERKKVLDKLGQQEGRLIGEIQQMYNTFKEKILVEIELKMNTSVDEVKVEIAKARKQAVVAYNEAEFSRVTISSTLKYCHKILDSAHDAEKLKQFQDIKTRLENLDIRKLETKVITPVFKLQPGTLAIPDLMVNMVTKLDKERFTSCLSEQYRQPYLKERATLVQCLNEKHRGERDADSNGLAVNNDLVIITSDKVEVFDKFGFLFEVDQGQHKLERPFVVACSDKGDIFVTDEGIKGVVRYDSKGQLVKVTPNVFSDVRCITCHDDQIIVTGDECVLIADFDCNVNKVISKESLELNTFRPYYVCVDNEGHLVVGNAGQGRVHVIDYNQPVIVKTFREQLGKFPQGVCVDEWGHILVSDRGNHQVVLMSGQSEHAHVIITSDDVRFPTDLAVTGPGEVAVLENDTGIVKVFEYADI